MRRHRKNKGGEPRPQFGPGAFRGYPDYRYGGSRPVTLAGPPIRKEKPIIKRTTRETLVNRTIEAMEDWRKTPFEHEGAVRAGLRIGFILQGHEWARSDVQAEIIVAEALHLVGAERPSHEEGQPGYALGSDYCHWCRAPIDEEERSRGRRFCSAHCARVAVDRMSRKTSHHYGAVLRSALRLLDQEKAEPQTCEFCAKSFQADRKQRFCSIGCSSIATKGDRYLAPRACALCATTFKPWTAEQRYCSRSCGGKANREIEAQGLAGVRSDCAECGTSFSPKVKRQRFCSDACSSRASGRAYKARNRAPTPPPALCSWCGDCYQPKIALRLGAPGYCSSKCSFDRSRHERGANLRDLTRRTFDHFLVKPIDDRWNRRLTPQRIDWCFLEIGRSITGEATMPRVTDALFA